MERAVPKEISRELLRWNIIASFHRIVYVALGLIGVL